MLGGNVIRQNGGRHEKLDYQGSEGGPSLGAVNRQREIRTLMKIAAQVLSGYGVVQDRNSCAECPRRTKGLGPKGRGPSQVPPNWNCKQQFSDDA